MVSNFENLGYLVQIPKVPLHMSKNNTQENSHIIGLKTKLGLSSPSKEVKRVLQDRGFQIICLLDRQHITPLMKDRLKKTLYNVLSTRSSIHEKVKVNVA